MAYRRAENCAAQGPVRLDPLTHLSVSRDLTALAAELFGRGQYLAAGELVWGAIVHAVSAADPDHEIQLPDRFGNSHQSPNTGATFTNAVRRIRERPLSERQIASCLDNGQQRLHNHFYHLNLTTQQIQDNVVSGTAYAQLLIRAAARALGQSRY